jgi:septal ring factor EnvC (AmiA/AmiB activator)
MLSSVRRTRHGTTGIPIDARRVGESLRVSGEETDRRIQAVTGQVEAVTGLIREVGMIAARHDEELEDHRRQIRQIYHRLEQYDARFDEHSRRLDEQSAVIRRLLEGLERRWGDGGSPRTG